MALKLLFDENFNNDVIIGLRKLLPEIDLVRNQDVGLRQALDPDVLAWAADHDRILVTHDRSTMRDHASVRLVAGLKMPGVFVLSDKLPIGRTIQALAIMESCSTQEEWDNRVIYLPL